MRFALLITVVLWPSALLAAMPPATSPTTSPAVVADVEADTAVGGLLFGICGGFFLVTALIVFIAIISAMRVMRHR